MLQLTGYIGRRFLKTLDHLLEQLVFACHLFALLFQRHKSGRVLVRRFTFEQIYFTGFQALPEIVPVALIIGSAIIIVFSNVSSQYDLGKIVVMLLVREIGPLVTALIVILRTATAVTVEIGYMKVLHEIDAIEMAGIDPLRIVCLPRFIGITTAILCLIVVCDMVALFGGYAIVRVLTQVAVGDLIRQIANAITLIDISVGLLKGICFGITITTICLYQGLGTRMQIIEIPARTSKVAVESFFYCLVVDILISILFYM